MTQTEFFIAMQSLWDLLLVVLACTITGYISVLILFVWSDEPLNHDDFFTRLVLRCRRLRDSNKK